MEKKNNWGLSIILVVIGIIIGVLATYILFNKLNEKTSKRGSNIEENVENIKSIKIDDNKDYIYAANYTLKTNTDSYYSEALSTQVNASDIVVPYINIDTVDAKTVNDKIYNLYSEIIDKFNKSSISKDGYYIVNYDSSINNEVLSIVIKTTIGGTDIPWNEYYVYNFDLSDGSLLNYDDLIKKIDKDTSTINNNVKAAIKNYIDEKMPDIKDNKAEFRINSGKIETAADATYNNYLDMIIDNKLTYYLDKDNKLNIVTNIYTLAGRGYIKVTFVID